MKTGRCFMTNQNTQNESVVKHSLTGYGMATVLTLLFLAVGARPARALDLQLNTNAPFVCAAVEGGNAVNKTPIIAYSCSAGFDQSWNYLEGQFVGGAGTNMCLDVADNGTTAGTIVDYYTCHGSQNQQWKIVPGADGTTAIVGVQSGYCLDAAGAAVGGGTQLVINPCSGSTTQNWNVRRSIFELNSGNPYSCIVVDNAETVSGEPVIAASCSTSFEDAWSYNYGSLNGIGTENAGKGEVYKCLTAQGSTSKSKVVISNCTPSALKATQLWTIENGTEFGLPASTLIVGVNGLCIDSEGGPSVGGGTQLIIDTCTGGTSQNWIMR